MSNLHEKSLHKDYGSSKNNNINLTKDIWIHILNLLPEKEWYRIKRLNKTLKQVVKDMCVNGRLEMLAKKGLIESCIKLLDRKKNRGVNLELEGACEGGHKEIIEL